MAGKFPGIPANPVKVQTELFDRTLRTTNYWVGISRQPNEILIPHLDSAADQLIAATYIDEQQIYPEQARPILAGEVPDPVLQQAQRFVVLRRHETEGWAELFATAVNILRVFPYSPRLPMEDIFDDVFTDPQQTVGSIEMSRFTSRYPLNEAIQHAGFICLMRSSFALALEIGAPYIYGATEEFVLDSIGRYNLPVETLGEPKRIKEAREDFTSLVPVRFDVNKISHMRDSVHPLLEHYLRDIEYHNGLGFFDNGLLATTDDTHSVEPNYPLPLYPDL